MLKWIAVMGMVLLSGCTSTTVKCDLEEGLEGTIAYAIETVGQCTGTAAVRTTVNGWVDKAGTCGTEPKSRNMSMSIGVCSIVISALSSAAQGAVNDTINSKFPGWNCNPAIVVSALEDIANTACAAVFPIAP